MKKIPIILLLLVLLSGTLVAQEKGKPFVLGTTEEIWSSQLSEKRVLNVYLPDEYTKNTDKTYPVIYLLDGSADEDFIHICGIVQFLTMIEAMPPTIVVGIANIDRRRDFTFPTSIDSDKKAYPTTGGSAKFLSFLEKDLEPYVQKKYRVSSSTIIGQSLGGLLASEVLLRKPALFSTYIIVSPSLWWDNESLLKKAPGLLKIPNKSTSVYITVGNEEQKMVDDAKNFAAILQEQMSFPLTSYYTQLPEEDHLTILHNAVYKALVKLYAPRK